MAKADQLGAKTFNFYPEEIYRPVRELAELLAARKTSLTDEHERLQSKVVNLARTSQK